MRKQQEHLRLTDKQRSILEHFVRCSKTPQRLVQRSQIIILLADGKGKRQVARELKVDKKTVKKWCNRWNESFTKLIEIEDEDGIKHREYVERIIKVFNDAPRSGAPPTFTAEQVVLIVAIGCEVIDDSDREYSRWTHKEIANEAVKRKIVDSISAGSVGRFLKDAEIKPHKEQYWVNTKEKDPEVFRKEAQEICDIYKQAPELHNQGIHIVSNDEKTGIQAIEREHKTLPAEPGGKLQKVESNYKRHGTLCLIANFEVATGEVIAPTIGPTRTEEDYAQHIAQTIATDPDARWIFIVDQLNTHQSESLVRLVAKECKIEINLGEKGKEGILKTMETRKNFLSETTHKIRFVYTPKHSSWLNQVEIWFSILTRRLIRHGNFLSLEHLKSRIEKFIDFFNRTMAKPFKWTYTGRPLTV